MHYILYQGNPKTFDVGLSGSFDFTEETKRPELGTFTHYAYGSPESHKNLLDSLADVFNSRFASQIWSLFPYHHCKPIKVLADIYVSATNHAKKKQKKK